MHRLHRRTRRLALIVSCLAAVTLCASDEAAAVTYRYALLVGNNTSEGAPQELPPLSYAEREVHTLAAQLVKFAHFSPDPARTVVLPGASRLDVLGGVERLAALAKADRSLHGGKANSLFLFFFTGHGIEGRLLLADGPFEAAALGRELERVAADVTVAIFDTCFAASLANERLRPKGPRIIVGDSILRRLPDEVLNAEGTLWFASSGSGEMSHEDEQMGGLFTHFWMEALERAEPDGPGITLERVWHYARTRTRAFAARHGKQQNPEQYIRGFRSREPLYFSFPRPRDARLRLAESVRGRFVVSYSDGQLIERIDKLDARVLDVALFPERAELMLLGEQGVAASRELTLRSGGTVVVHGPLDALPQGRPLWRKGETLGTTGWTARWIEDEQPARTLLQVGYVFSVPGAGVLSPAHGVGLGARFAFGDGLVAGARLGWGRDSQEHAGLRYRLDVASLSLRGGYELRWEPIALAFLGSLGAGHLWQTFQDDDSERRAWSWGPAAIVELLVRGAGWALGMEVVAGGTLAPGAAAGYSHRWRGVWGAGLSIGVML